MTAKELAVRALRAARRRMAHRTGTAPVPLVVPGARRTGPRRVRLVREPVFILSYMRSGSTLLRVVLDSHSQICAPLEMHLRSLRATPGVRLAESALTELGLTTRDLENMLWDRVLYDRLLHSKKSVIVDKTPSNVNDWRRIHRYWPRAKSSCSTGIPSGSWTHGTAHVRTSHGRSPPPTAALHRAHAAGTAGARRAGGALRGVDPSAGRHHEENCDYIGVPWEPQMIDYGTKDHGPFVRGLGDWAERSTLARSSPHRRTRCPRRSRRS